MVIHPLLIWINLEVALKILVLSLIHISKNETAPEAEPSVEREGPFYFLFAERTEKNTVAQTNFLVWIRHWLLAPLKSQKKNILPEQMAPVSYTHLVVTCA